MALALDANTVKRIRELAAVTARHLRPHRARVVVTELRLADDGVIARFGCGQYFPEEPGEIFFTWKKLEILLS